METGKTNSGKSHIKSVIRYKSGYDKWSNPVKWSYLSYEAGSLQNKKQYKAEKQYL